MDGGKLKSAKSGQAKMVMIDTTDGVKINDAEVIQSDVERGNGVIYLIGTMSPPEEWVVA